MVPFAQALFDATDDVTATHLRQGYGGQAGPAHFEQLMVAANRLA